MKTVLKVLMIIVIVSSLLCVPAMSENLESSNDVAFDKLKSYIVEKGWYDSSNGEYVVEVSKEILYSDQVEGVLLLKYAPTINYILAESMDFNSYKVVLWIGPSEKTYFANLLFGNKSIVTGVMERSSAQINMNTNVPITTDEISQEYSLTDSEIQEIANMSLEIIFSETFAALEYINSPVQLKELGFVQLPGIEDVANARKSNSYNVVTVYAPDGRSETINIKDLQAWKNVGWYESAFEAQIGICFDDKLCNDITYILLQESGKDAGTGRFCLGFVNGDDIPDILFSSGMGVGVFILENRTLTLIKNNDEDAYEENRFGQRGCLEYLPKKNRIYSSYGGSAFMPVFEKIENGKSTIVCKMSAWHNVYHSGDKEISQLRFYDLFDSYYNDGAGYIKAEYNKMYPITVENVKKAFKDIANSDASNVVKMYAPDGRTESVYTEDVEAWKNVGWYDYPVRTMYTLDGRSAVVPGEDLLEWVNVGWHTRDSIQMFSPDKDSEEVKLQDIEAWKKVGWYDYPVIRLYSVDGESTVAAEKDQEDWLKAGWHREWETITMYTLDGRSSTVKIKDVKAWKNVGWYDAPPTVLYSSSGSVTVSGGQKEAYKKKGWRELHEFFLEKKYNWFNSYYGKLTPAYSWEGGNFYFLPGSSVTVGFPITGTNQKCTTIVADSVNVLFPDLAVFAKNGTIDIATICDYFNQYNYSYDYFDKFDCYRIIYEVYSKYTKSSYYIVFYTDDGRNGTVDISTDVDVYLK